MVNAVTQQILVDGERNVVVKVDGYLDTSDLAATGTLGTGATGATTINSPIITFTAGGLAPVKGQFITGTGIPAGAYVLSVDSATQVTLNTNATATGASLTFTLVAGPVVFIDPQQLSYMIERTLTKATQLRIDRIIYTVEETLAVTLLWDATTTVRIIDLVKAGHQELKRFGGYTNNAGTGKTGRILVSTEGWASTKILEFTILVELVKE